MLFFLKGSTLIYAGQEYENTHLPSLFEKDVFLRDPEKDRSEYFAKLAKIKKTVLSCRDYLIADADDKNNTAILIRDDGIRQKLGVFSLSGKHNDINVKFKDGEYTNQIDGKSVIVRNGILRTDGEPIIITSL